MLRCIVWHGKDHLLSESGKKNKRKYIRQRSFKILVKLSVNPPKFLTCFDVTGS